MDQKILVLICVVILYFCYSNKKSNKKETFFAKRRKIKDIILDAKSKMKKKFI